MSMDHGNHFLFSEDCYFDMDSSVIIDTSDSPNIKYIPIAGAERTVLRKLIEDHPKPVHKDQFCALIQGRCDESHVRRIINKLKNRHECLAEWIPYASQGEYRLQDPKGPNATKKAKEQVEQSNICMLRSTGICVRPNFVKEARQDIFAALDEAFDESHVVFLQGIGGIGKSEAAKHWALQKKKERLFDTVVFAQLNSENENSNVQSLIADDTVFVISGAFRSRDEEEATEAYFQRKLAKIKQITDERTLIIIDNYDIDDPKLAELFTGPYRLLVTTRNKQAGYDFPLIPVAEIQEAEHLKDIFFKNLGDERDDIDREDPYIEKLFALVSNHTLSIEIIAKSLVNSSDTPEILYQKIGDQEQHNLMRNVDGLVVRNFSEKALTSYECIRRLFNLSRLERDEDFEYKSQVLVFLAAMPTRGIELSLFKKWSDSRIIRAKNSLVQKSWLRQDKAKGVALISMHPLIREIVWSELEPSLEKCSIIIDRFINEDSTYIDDLYNQPKKIKDTYEQIALSLLSSFPIRDLKRFDFYIKLQRIFHTCTSFDSKNSVLSLELCNIIKAILEQNMLTSTWRYGFINYRIGATYSWVFRDRDKGTKYFGEGLKIMESSAHTNEEKMWLAISYRETASTDCRDENLFHRNTPYNPSYTVTIEQLLDKGEKLISELQKNGFHKTNVDLYHGTVCVWRSRIALYHGDLSLANDFINEAESEFMRFGYPNAGDKAAVADTRALICSAQGAFDKQVSFLKEATKVFENCHGEYHRNSIERATKLAAAYQNNNQPEEAIKVLNHYQKIAEEMLGEDAALSVTIRNQLKQLKEPKE